MAATSTSNVLDEAEKELREAVELLDGGQPSRVLNNRVKQKIEFALACITAKKKSGING